MTTQTGGSGEGRSRWFNILLIASLALNLLFIGGIAKAAWHHRHGWQDGPGFMGFARDLAPDRRKMLREDMTATRVAVDPLRQKARDLWSEANKILLEEPFDKAKYKSAMDRVTEAEGQLKTAIRAAISETAAKLTPDERRALQAWREERKSRMFGKRHKRDEGMSE